LSKAIQTSRRARSPAPALPRKLSSQEEALLVATACSSPPEAARWTLALLAGEVVKLTEHEGLSRGTGAPTFGAGGHPADIPFEQPTHFEMGVNVKTAAGIGATLLPAFLARADEVIE
jgi:hypothetical protein